MADSLTIEFTKEKDTPGTIRYKEVGEAGVRPTIGSLYIIKSEVEKIGSPNRLIVTITPVGS